MQSVYRVRYTDIALCNIGDEQGMHEALKLSLCESDGSDFCKANGGFLCENAKGELATASSRMLLVGPSVTEASWTVNERQRHRQNMKPKSGISQVVLCYLESNIH